MSDIGRGLLKPIIYTNPGESTDPADYRKEKIAITPELNPFATPEVAKAMEAGRSKPLRGMSSVIFHIDDFCGPSEELIFEEEGVKFYRVHCVKFSDGIWRGVKPNAWFAIDVEIDGAIKRGFLFFKIKPDYAFEEEIKKAYADQKLPDGYLLPEKVTNRITNYLHDDIVRRSISSLMDGGGFIE